MSAATVSAYRFSTAAQWARCLEAAEPYAVLLDARAGTPGTTFEAVPDLMAAPPDGDPVWVAAGRLTSGDCADMLTGPVRRLLVDRALIWLLTEGVILGVDRASFQLFRRIERDGVIDIASDGHDGLWLLMASGPARLGRPDAGGDRIYDENWSIAQAGGKPILLGAAQAKLLVFTANGLAVEREIDLHDVKDDHGRWFNAKHIESGYLAVLLTGAWTEKDGKHPPEPGFLYLDAAGEPIILGRWHSDPPVMIATAGDDLLALFKDEAGSLLLRRFADRSNARATRRLTPTLASDTLEGRWVSAQIVAHLPEGATLTVRWAATRDEGLAATINGLFSRSGPASKKRDDIDRLIGARWSTPVVYRGIAHDGPVPAEAFNVPLHEAQGNLLWAAIDYTPGDNGEPVVLDELVIRHDGRTLRDDLPAVFRGPNGDGDGTLARLAGTLEATTQDIDRTIATLGDWLDPERVPDRWLPILAALLDIPFSDGLDAGTQRNLLKAATALLAGRGARGGLIALLEALFPGRPYSVEDRTTMLATLTLGSGRLPALLTGASPRVPRLNARLVLGRTPLCPTDPCDPLTVGAPAEVLVTIPVLSRERRRHGAIIAQMIDAMLPANVRARLRWITWNGAVEKDCPVLTMLADPRPLRLGNGQPLGRAQVGGRKLARLDEGGVPIGHRLI